jgi:hypothetical protein
MKLSYLLNYGIRPYLVDLIRVTETAKSVWHHGITQVTKKAIKNIFHKVCLFRLIYSTNHDRNS